MARLQRCGRLISLHAGLSALLNQNYVRFLDTTHSALVYASIWISLIYNYGNELATDNIPMYVCDAVHFYTMAHGTNIDSPLAVRVL